MDKRKKRMTLDMPHELLAAIERVAAIEDRSMAAVMRLRLREALEREGALPSEADRAAL